MSLKSEELVIIEYKSTIHPLSKEDSRLSLNPEILAQSSPSQTYDNYRAQSQMHLTTVEDREKDLKYLRKFTKIRNSKLSESVNQGRSHKRTKTMNERGQPLSVSESPLKFRKSIYKLLR